MYQNTTPTEAIKAFSDVINNMWPNAAPLPTISEGLAEFLIENTHGIESAIMASILMMIMARGGTASACMQLVSDPDHPVPAHGCERDILNTLLTAMVQRSQAPDKVRTVVSELAVTIDALMSLVTQPRTSRDDLATWAMEMNRA